MGTAWFGKQGVWILSLTLLWGTLGCGSGGDAPDTAAAPETPAAGNLPTTAIPAKEGAKLPEPEINTPEWFVREIMLERLKTPPKTENVEEIRAFQRDRNYKIVEYATQIIKRTHDAPALAEQFDVAVHHAMEAQLQLAIQINSVPAEEHKQNVEELYENVEMLLKRDPKSQSAAEASFTLVKFAEIMAQKLASEDPRWLEEYARQSQLFAQNFPEDAGRAIAKLDAAGWSCEAHGQTELAIACYSQIGQLFPENPRAQHVPAVLRRLQLPGQELKLAGPTQDGKFLSIETLRNKAVLVAFWAADTQGFEKDAAILNQVHGKYAAHGFEIVGVNLDENEAQFQAFAKKNGFTWPNIFYSDQTKRRWNNPLVRYYGIREIPTYWLIDKQGQVIETQVDLTTLDANLPKLLTN